MNTLASSAFAFSLPAGAAPASAAPLAARAAFGPAGLEGAALQQQHPLQLLRAEVEPQARGLSVQAHAERVLAALRPQG